MRAALLLLTAALLVPILAHAGSVDLAWDQSMEGPLATGYVVMRKVMDGLYTEIARTGNLTYIDTAAPTTYPICYHVLAYLGLTTGWPWYVETSTPSNEVCLNDLPAKRMRMRRAR